MVDNTREMQIWKMFTTLRSVYEFEESSQLANIRNLKMVHKSEKN